MKDMFTLLAKDFLIELAPARSIARHAGVWGSGGPGFQLCLRDG